MQQMHPFSMMQEVQPGLVSAHSGRFQGRVKSYNGSKGWGFIECAETYLLYQCDVFLTKTRTGPRLRVGGSVEFSVVLKGPQGEPHACNTTPLDAPAMDQIIQPNRMQSNLGGTHSGRFLGTVKSYNHAKGWGFIECQETYALFQCDVFLTKMHAFELGVGGSVEFSVILKGPQGEPHAVDTLPLGPQTRRGLGAGRGSKGKGKNRGFRKKRGDRNNTKRAEQDNITV